MNKRTAKKLLLEQKKKLDDVKNRNDHWILHSGSLIDKIFGKDSNEYRYFSKFRFDIQYIPGQMEIVKDALINGKITGMKQFIDNCIRSIELLSLPEGSRQNITSNLDPISFWSIVLSVAVVVFGAGFSIGKYMSDVQNIELRHQVSILYDSLATKALPNRMSNSDSTQKAQYQYKMVK